MATRAVRVRLHARGTQDQHAGVAVAACFDVLFSEGMRPVATDAVTVSFCEKCGCRHGRLPGPMALRTTPERIRSGSVLVLVAGRANLGGVSAACRVSGRNVSMALGAGAGFWHGVLMHAVAGDAIAGRVDANGRSVALVFIVATQTVAGSRQRMSRVLRFFGKHECMAIHTIRGRLATKAGHCLRARVLEAALFLMTAGTAHGGDRAHGGLRESVAFDASDALLQNVNFVTTDAPRRVPLERHVHALTIPRVLVRLGARDNDRPCQA